MKIGERGQITIPKNLREKYGFVPNIEIEFVTEETGIRIQKKASIEVLLKRFMVEFGKISLKSVEKAFNEGSLIINDIVYAELVPQFNNKKF